MTGDARTPEEAARERRLRELTDDGEIISHAEYTKRSRRAFLSFAGLGIAGYVGFNRLQNQEENESIPRALRAGLRWNERVWEAVQRDGATARTFSIDDREEIRVNGRHGLEDDDRDLIEVDAPDVAGWEIALTGTDGAPLDPIPLAAIQADFEVHDMVWEHKCVEGWSNIVHWTGARFADFLAQYGPADDDWAYVQIERDVEARRMWVAVDGRPLAALLVMSGFEVLSERAGRVVDSESDARAIWEGLVSLPDDRWP